jgi:hypothetical protein
MGFIRKTIWWIFGTLSILVGLYPLIYFVIDRKFGLLNSKSPELLGDIIWNTGFYGHIVFGGLALGIGWLQFSKKIRNTKIQLHRRIGKIYLMAVLISGVCSIYIAFFATGGIVPQLGFGSLGVVWLGTTGLAYKAVLNRDISKHESYMIFSYAACFAAVTLRIWLPILTSLTGEFVSAYRMVAWLCWVPNIIVAYIIVVRNKNFATDSIP